MEDEEQRWLDAQQATPATGSEFGLRDQEGEERVDVVMNEKMVVEETAVVDENMNKATTMDPDDDIIPGCYMLDINIDGLKYSKLWIRAEYIRVFNSVNAYYDEPTSTPGAPCVVVTGQPGIGKSVWVYYALRRCLAERKPVIWYSKRCCYMFAEDGVYEMPADFQRANLKSYIWTLVDSDEAPDGVPPYLVPHRTPLFVIFSTSPRDDRWSRLHKTVRPMVAIMNPWKRKEILRAATIYPLGCISESRTNEIFDQLGPTPRLCIDYQLNSKAMSRYESNLRTALSKVTSNDLELLLITACDGDLGIDTLSDKIALLSRESLDDVYSQGMVIPITPYIQSRLSNRCRNLERKELLRLYKAFARVPEGRTMAGVFFDALGQTALQEGITHELVPMVKLDEA
ncbi:uncharacterized protein LACBIDRAFT_294749 [Laccaria bicolor S238N-H82]|uniref:Predicted protein n=1 Tax=Laccaria bicolor (strain S238N-H82 / ATCC MYA-4686) TaxID=486041 RepID=B0DHH6_LACBS|nr:uncharacterized protein LACBIDRAFT_294749 [Laccaria bicolor S238N-H82]EDR06022.1 predicted protein [Laccaria bicolor S238N-H82]|eukprot:XP_001883310.1 predicted protein [Laccaria bicolor S238N-H82]